MLMAALFGPPHPHHTHTNIQVEMASTMNRLIDENHLTELVSLAATEQGLAQKRKGRKICVIPPVLGHRLSGD